MVAVPVLVLLLGAGCDVDGGSATAPHGEVGHRGRWPRAADLALPVEATVAGAGDLTGDGLDDLVVADETNRLLQVVSASLAFPALTPGEVVPLGDAGAPCGIAPGGDPLGNGRAHLLVQVADDCYAERTAVLLFEQTDDGLASVWQARLPAEVQRLGLDLAVGDINGDGLDDVVLGQESTSERNGNNGRIQAAIYPGDTEGLPEEAAWTRDVHRRGMREGSSATTGGDFNGDGYADIVASDIEDRGSCYRPFGTASAFAGGASGPEFEPSWLMPEGAIGYDARLTGDLDGDGFDDVVMSTICGGLHWGNTIFVVPGSAGGLTEIVEDPAWQINDGLAFTDFARDFDVADLNGDGTPELLAATSEYGSVDQAQRYRNDQGMGMLWVGTPTGFAACPPIVKDAITPWPNAYLSAPGAGQGIRAVGDLDGDGRGDVAVYGKSAHIFLNPPLDTRCAPVATE